MKAKIILILIMLSTLYSNLNARYYDPDTGRFTTADTVTPEGGANSQGLNRYSYCSNNPVKYVDPTGHEGFISDMIASTKELIKVRIQSLKNQFNPSKSLSFYGMVDKEYYEQYKTISDSIYNNSFMENLVWAYNDTKKDINASIKDIENRPGWWVPIIGAATLDAYFNKKLGIPHLTGENLKKRIAESPHEFKRGLLVDDTVTGIFYKLHVVDGKLEIEFTTTKKEMLPLAAEFRKKGIEIDNDTKAGLSLESIDKIVNERAKNMKGTTAEISEQKTSLTKKYMDMRPDWAKKLDKPSK